MKRDAMDLGSDQNALRRLSLLVVAASAVVFSGCNIGCWFVSCDKFAYVRAMVRDPSGAPLADAHVDIDGFSGEADRSGCLMLPVHFSTLDVHVTQAGYKPFDQTFPVSLDTLDITLQPTASEKASSAVAAQDKSKTAHGCV